MNRTEKDLTFDLNRFKENSALGIIRGATSDSVLGLLDACLSGGLQFIEFTLNSEGALSFIESGSKDFLNTLCIGAGTVVSGDLSDGIRFTNVRLSKKISRPSGVSSKTR